MADKREGEQLKKDEKQGLVKTILKASLYTIPAVVVGKAIKSVLKKYED